MSPFHSDLHPQAFCDGNHPSPHAPKHLLRRGLHTLLLSLLLLTSLISNWGFSSSHASAAASGNPNPKLPVPAWLKPPPKHKPIDLNHYVKQVPPTPQMSEVHLWQVSMKPARVALTGAALHFLSSDGQLEVNLPAGSIDAAQLTQAGGTIALYITQVRPASGGLRGEHIFFGSYQFQFFTASSTVIRILSLTHPFTISYHLRPEQASLLVKGQLVYALWSATQTATSPPSLTATTVVTPKLANTRPPTLAFAQGDGTGLVWSVVSSLSSDAQHTLVAPASSITFGTQAPQATWGNPTDAQVGLSGGTLDYSYPLSLPPGPGGLQPSLPLTYSSGAVNGNHGLQTAAPWVGQGWNLNMGSISWGQENVTPNGNPTLENVWHINDPGGISGQLIPPDLKASTIPPFNPSSPNIYIWHTAPESHAKVNELMGGTGPGPCFRVYLPSGVMEEFGCIDEARQAYVDAAGVAVAWRWDLDLMTDRYGNQVHVHYQRLHEGPGYVQDAVPSSVEYDDPTCHNTTTACSTWNPRVKLIFDASQKASQTSSACANWTNTRYRCDSPVALGSGTLPVPKVLSSYVLNDLKVEINGNVLREYVFSYNQSGPQTITDPSTGQQESIAGYLNLTKIEQLGTGGTSLNAPVVNIQYTKETQHYSDLFSYATPSSNCSPTSWSPRDGSGTGPCYLWSQSYNAYYITSLDNGWGLQENISWQEAHGNTRGIDGGLPLGINNAFACTGHESSTNTCGRADDKNWSRIVVASRTKIVNTVSSKWTYSYYLQEGLKHTFPGNSAIACSASQCQQGFDWGNQNDGDFADYYNGDFQSFYQVQVVQPDNSYQIHTYGATTGWGLANSSISCFISPTTCDPAPYNSGYTNNGHSVLATVFAGREQDEKDYTSDNHLLREHSSSWAANCPPHGVAGSVNASGGATDPGSGFLFSELDHNNPVMVCDPRATQMDSYLTDGVTSTITDPRVVHETKKYTYDVNDLGGCANNNNYDYGNLTTQDETANDVGSLHSVTETVFCPNDNLGSGIYLVSLVAKTWQQDQNSNEYGCHMNFYGSNTGDLQAPAVPNLTSMNDHIAYNGTTQNCPGPVNVIKHSYDAYGNAITATDPDAHLGCTVGSNQYSACAIYDSAATHLVSAANAKNQITTYAYDSTAAGGFSEWLTSTTDVNGQTTTYQYDVLGRLSAVIRPGDSASAPTVSYQYSNTCPTSSTNACLELDTTTRFTVGSSSTSTMKQWYDGMGNLVETQTPSPTAGKTIVIQTIYDVMGRVSIKSLPFAIATPSGYVAPTIPMTQPHSVTNYDALGRSLGSATYSDASTVVLSSSVSYTVATGVPGFATESGNAYEQTMPTSTRRSLMPTGWAARVLARSLAGPIPTRLRAPCNTAMTCLAILPVCRPTIVVEVLTPQPPIARCLMQ